MQTIETLADIQKGLAHLSTTCPRLADIISTGTDVPLRRSSPSFESLASIIVSQQVSKQSAEAIFGRMQEHIHPLKHDTYSAASDETLKTIGLSRPKQRTFNALCEALKSGQLDLETLANFNAEKAVEQMTAVKGIGPWTAEVYLMFAIGHPDIFPAGDLALQEAAKVIYELEDRPDAKTLREMSESWAPWRAVAARLLWAHYADIKGRSAMP